MSGRKRNVQFSKPEEPAFIKRMKEQAGITEGPHIDTKHEPLEKASDEDLADREDEEPVIVVLKKGDLSEEQVRQHLQMQKDKEEEEALRNDKILYRKPDAKQMDEKKKQMIQTSFNNKNTDDNKQKHVSTNSNTKSVKNSSLLSFDDEDEEEESD